MCNIAKKILQIKLLYVFCFLFSTCVDEALLCKGIPLCKNKNDLKACKMNLPNMNWEPISLLSTCIPVDHPEYTMPYGQTINSDLIATNSQFYCLNRGDTNPYLITNSESNETDADSKTWKQWMNEPCDEDLYNPRRCLGLRPNICVDAHCKYIFVNQICTKIHTTRTSKFNSHLA